MQEKEHSINRILSTREDRRTGLSCRDREDGAPAPLTLPSAGRAASSKGEALRDRWVRLIDSLDY